jgi:hypothetical protein
MPLFRKTAISRNSSSDIFGLVQNSLFNYLILVSIRSELRLFSGREKPTMAVKSSISDLDAQIEKLRERRRSLIVKSAERFARAAMKSGLAETEIADEEIDRIFEEIAARFRKGKKKGVVGPAPQAPIAADRFNAVIGPRFRSRRESLLCSHTLIHAPARLPLCLNAHDLTCVGLFPIRRLPLRMITGLPKRAVAEERIHLFSDPLSSQSARSVAHLVADPPTNPPAETQERRITPFTEWRNS